MHFYNKVVGMLLRQNSSFGKTEKYTENPTWFISIGEERAPPIPQVFQLGSVWLPEQAGTETENSIDWRVPIFSMW